MHRRETTICRLFMKLRFRTIIYSSTVTELGERASIWPFWVKIQKWSIYSSSQAVRYFCLILRVDHHNRCCSRQLLGHNCIWYEVLIELNHRNSGNFRKNNVFFFSQWTTYPKLKSDSRLRDCDGCSPVHLAARNNQVEALILLCKHGAEMTARIPTTGKGGALFTH